MNNQIPTMAALTVKTNTWKQEIILIPKNPQLMGSFNINVYSPPTCVEDMHINLTECLVVLPGAVASKGVHLVPHRHSSMVDSPRPSF